MIVHCLSMGLWGIYAKIMHIVSSIVAQGRHMSTEFSPLVREWWFSAAGRSRKTLTGYRAATWATMDCCLVLSSLCKSPSRALSTDNPSLASCNLQMILDQTQAATIAKAFQSRVERKKRAGREVPALAGARRRGPWRAAAPARSAPASAPRGG